MKQTFTEKIAELLNSNRRHKRWMRVLSGMMAAVLFATTYMLILPAITLENDTLTCGMEEHTHTEACYETRLVCTENEGEGHTHTAECYPAMEYTCGQEESAGHVHTDACYTVTKALTCGQDESAGHTHGESCYDENGTLICTETESSGHTHTDACYTEERVLTCGQEESAGHTHTDACGAAPTEPICGVEVPAAHVHDESCYERVLGCKIPEHQHGQECYEVAEEALEEEIITSFPEKLPEGYEPYTYEDESGLSVLAYAPKDAFGGAAAALKAERLDENSEEYAAAGANLDAEGVERDGFAALDISFVNGADEEIEPSAASGRVYIKIIAVAIIPEDADPESIAVQHHRAEENTLLGFIPAGEKVVVETVADNTNGTGEVVVISGEEGEPRDVESSFPVESFSVFTLTWNSSNGLSIQCIDSSNTDITAVLNTVNITSESTVVNIAPDISGYEFARAVIAADAENAITSTVTVARLRRSSGNWQYNRSASGGTWSNIGANKVFFIYTPPMGTVPTINTSSKGITINVFDYDATAGNINYNHPLKFVQDNAGDIGSRSWSTTPWNVWTDSNGGVYQGIVAGTLGADGYPVLNSAKFGGGAESLAYLFNPNISASGKTAYSNANYLFRQSADGYYYYNSAVNFAKLDTSSKAFTVYNQPIDNGTEAGAPKFLPFDNITDISGYDYHFGMTVETEFMMPKNGLVNGNDMVFEFAGDDDVWLFIDGVLALDMGGIHYNYSGQINFATGVVYISNVNSGAIGSSSSYSTTLSALMTAAKGADWVSQNMVQKDGNWIFKDYTTHSFKFYYMERGAGGSNCKILFNLPTIPTGSIAVTKNVSATPTYLENHADDTYRMQLYVDGAVWADKSYTLADDSSEHMTDANGYFSLEDEHTAIFSGIPADAEAYYVRESGVTSGVTFKQLSSENFNVSFNDTSAEIASGAAQSGSYEFDESAANSIVVTNTPIEGGGPDDLFLSLEKTFSVPGLDTTLNGFSSLIGGSDYTVRIYLGDSEEDATDDNLLAAVTPTSITTSDGTTSNGITIAWDSETQTGTITWDVLLTQDITSETSLYLTEEGHNSLFAGYTWNSQTGFGINSITPPVLTVGESNRITTCSANFYNLGSNVDFIVAKLTENAGYLVYSMVPLSVGERESIVAWANTQPGGFGLTMNNTSFYSYVNNPDGFTFRDSAIKYPCDPTEVSQMILAKPTMTILKESAPDPNGTYLYFGNPDQWAQFIYGSYTIVSGEMDIQTSNTYAKATMPLSLTKHVVRTDGVSVDPDGEYTFEVSIPAANAGGYTVTYTNADAGGPKHTDSTLVFAVPSAGGDYAVGELKLYNNETAVISGMPIEGGVQITETETDGYAVNWSGDILGGVNAAAVTVDNTKENPAIICTNTTGALLPHTGGTGSMPLLILGAIFTIGAGGLLLRRRSRKEDGGAV